MKNINWKRKLTSRKMWAAVATFVAMMIVATGGSENTATQITGLIMAGGSMIAYIIGEGFADAAHQDDVLEESTDSTDSEETEE